MSKFDPDMCRKYPELTFAVREVLARGGTGGKTVPPSRKRIGGMG